jgi:hypothetical protein
MNRKLGVVLGFAALVAVVAPASGQGGGAAAPLASVTLFNSGRVLVRRALPLAVSSGEGTYTVALGEFNPVTFAVLDPGVQVVSVTTDAALSEQTLLRRYVGRTLDIDTGSGRAASRQATLLAVDPERWEWADRPGVIFQRPGRIVWPKELVPTVKLADITLSSDRARSSVKMMYETSGSSWAASYRLFLGSNGRLEGAALLGAGTLLLPNTEVQLLSGDIGQGAPPQLVMGGISANGYMAGGSLAARDEPGVRKAMMMEATPSVSSEAAGEGHLYTLPRPVSFTPGTSVVVPLFEPVPAKADRVYVVNGAMPYYGGFGQQQNEEEVPVGVSYHLARRNGTPFGDLPLPGGYVGVFDLDKSGRVQLVGQGYIGHTAPGAEMMVDAGSAFDITAKRVQTDYSTTRTGGGVGTPVRTAAIAAYRVTLQNAKDSAVEVEVREDRGGEWSILDSSVPPIKQSATRTVFMVAIPARGTATLTYRLRVVW